MTVKAKEKRNYLKGSAKEVNFSNGGAVIHVDMKIEELNKLPVNEAGYIKITISKLPDKDTYGNTHCIFENTWRPSAESQATSRKANPPVKSLKSTRATDDLPF